MRIGVLKAGRFLLGPSFEFAPVSTLAELACARESSLLQACVTWSIVGIAQDILPQRVKTVKYMMRRFAPVKAPIKFQHPLPNGFLLCYQFRHGYRNCKEKRIPRTKQCILWKPLSK